ncbi:uncharacterized protein LOC127717632 isoform X2 [Mytilus californianus]|uniref:uncharacterized protein LOC127717632 isoform X2 n=1 Tax=Mytilus californianus TaxID=6549 RepID=UPI002245366C|nr:uncharacterized protein LOC127717632 isoform X2 [Mytilus californianus]
MCYQNRQINRKDRISLEILHATNHLLLSKKVSKSTFALIPQTSVVAVHKKCNQYEKDTFIAHALRYVGKVLLPRSSDSYGLLPSITDLIGSMMYRRQIYGTNDINPGDIIVFLYHGLFQKGVILSKHQAPNNLLQVTVYCIDEAGCVSETNSIYNLDKEIVTRYAYSDLDSVIRKRVLYTAEQMKGMCLFRGLVQKSLRFVLGCLSGDLLYTQHQPIFIGFRETKLKTSAFPRIENIERWMNSNCCDNIPDTIKENVPSLHLCPTILVLTSTDGETEPALLFEDKHIIKTKVETFSSPSRAKERIRRRCNVCKTTKAEPIVVCMLGTDEHGD